MRNPLCILGISRDTYPFVGRDPTIRPEREPPPMATLFLLTGLALAIFALALGALVWSVRSGQYDDLDTPGVRLLADDVQPAKPRPHLTADRTPHE